MSGPDKPDLPSAAELNEMDRDQLVTLGMKLDGVEMAEIPEPWPVKDTRAEKRAERQIAFWFTIAGLAGLAFIAAFLFWPWQYKSPLDSEKHYFIYSLYTPILGITLGLAILGVGIAVTLYMKKFIPHEVAVQDRHDKPSSELDKKTILAQLADSGNRSTIARRSMIKRSAGFGAGVLGLGVGVFA